MALVQTPVKTHDRAKCITLALTMVTEIEQAERMRQLLQDLLDERCNGNRTRLQTITGVGHAGKILDGQRNVGEKSIRSVCEHVGLDPAYFYDRTVRGDWRAYLTERKRSGSGSLETPASVLRALDQVRPSTGVRDRLLAIDWGDVDPPEGAVLLILHQLQQEPHAPRPVGQKGE